MGFGTLLVLVISCGIPKAYGDVTPSLISSSSQAVSAPIDVQRFSIIGIQNIQLYSQTNEALDGAELTNRLDTLQNVEISSLLRTSQSSADTGFWCDGLGLGLGAVGASFEIAGSGDWQTTGFGFLLGGLGLKLAGSFFMDQAGTALFNAVESYNRSYWNESDDLSTAKFSKGLIPIHTHFSTLGGFEYQCSGKRLESDQDFAPLFEAANDYEAKRLFKDAESSGTTGSLLELVGGLGCLGSGMGYFTSGSSKDKTGYAWAFVSSTVVGIVGNLFLKGAESSKFNAVQRYNRFARGQEAVLPKDPENEKELLNFGSPASSNPRNP